MILLPLSEDDRMDADEHDITSFLHLQRLLDIQRQSAASEKMPGMFHNNAVRTSTISIIFLLKYWVFVITLARLIAGLTSQILKIQLSTASLARKQNNYKLAESVLLSQIDNLMKPNMENGRVAPENLLSALSTLQSNKKAVSQLEVLRVEREGAKLLHSMAQQKESIDILSSSIVGFICADLKQEKKDKEFLESCSQLCGKSLLTLVKWLQLDYKNLSSIVTQGSQLEGEDSVLAGNLKLLMETEARAAGQGMGLVMEENSKLRERERKRECVFYI